MEYTVQSGRETLPEVSVLIPARNEEANLGTCLRSLIAQKGVDFEILVVDDESTDRTREIALSFPGVRLIQAQALRPGETGKCNALATGSQQARGEWLLFTDADTVHLPGSLAGSLAEAKAHAADLLSYSPEQVVEGFWEKVVMPVVFAELTAVYRTEEVNDPLSPAAAANGQYLLIRREVYDQVGGHAALCSTLLEDVELARRVKASGHKLRFRFGGDAVRTRMYRNYQQMQEGWTKNLTLLFAEPDRLAVKRGVEFGLMAGAAALAVAAAAGKHKKPALLCAAVAFGAYANFLRRIRRAHFSWDANLMSVAGLPIFASLLLGSQRAHHKAEITWRGRTYRHTQERISKAEPVPTTQGA